MKKNLILNFISLVCEIAIFVCVLVGVLGCVLAPAGTFMGGVEFLFYFTIQSNIITGLVAFCAIFINLAFVFNPKVKSLKVFSIIHLVTTVSICLTGCVFCFMLAPLLPGCWSDSTQVILHVVVPVLGLIDYLLCARRYSFKWTQTFFVAVEPIAYTIFVVIAYCLNLKLWANTNFPYFFFDFGSTNVFFGLEIPAPIGSICWILVLSVGILGVGFLFAAITKLLNKRYLTCR